MEHQAKLDNKLQHSPPRPPNYHCAGRISRQCSTTIFPLFITSYNNCIIYVLYGNFKYIANLTLLLINSISTRNSIFYISDWRRKMMADIFTIFIVNDFFKFLNCTYILPLIACLKEVILWSILGGSGV